MQNELIISATTFKAKCLSLLSDLSEGRLSRVRITKRGKVVGELLPPRNEPEHDLWGSMRDEIFLDPTFDFTEPVGEPGDAERGILLNEDEEPASTPAISAGT
jgi:hypothetical protein